MRILARRTAAAVLGLALSFPLSGVTVGQAAENPPEQLLFGFTLTPITPLTLMQPVIDFTGPYFRFLLSNGAQPDSFRMRVENLTQPTWFPQVCLRSLCYPDSAKVPFFANSTDTVGVNIIPFSDGVGDADFRVISVGNPSLQYLFHVRLYAGTAAVDVRPVTSEAPVLQLAQSFPNPAARSARIGFVLPDEDRVSLRLFDAGGRLVATLVDGTLAAGPHSVEWRGDLASGRAAPSGTYFYRLETTSGSRARSLVLLR